MTSPTNTDLCPDMNCFGHIKEVEVCNVCLREECACHTHVSRSGDPSSPVFPFQNPETD